MNAQDPAEHAVDVAGATLRAVTVGQGPPAVVLAGGPGFGFTYLYPSLTERLADRLRMTFYDYRGTGASTGSDRPADLTIHQFIADLDAVRASIGLDEWIVLGHSFGGLLALRYALHHPDRTRGVVLIDADPARYEDWNAFRPVVVARRTDQERARMARWSGRSGWERRPDAVEAYFRSALAPYFADPRDASTLRFGFDADGLARQRTVSQAIRADLGEWDLTDRLRTLAVPVQLIYGAKTIFPIAAAESLAAILPDAEFILLDDAGHFPFLEAGPAFESAVTSFVGRVGAR